MAPAPSDCCVFCAIVSEEAPASVVYEDDATVAFMDLRSVTPGHVLVVPRGHAVGLEDLDERVGAGLWTAAHRVARGLRRSSLRCEGVNLTLADGTAAGQDVFHIHLHVFPRFAGDGYRISADRRVKERAELDTAAAAVREGLSLLPA
jgi:diadenosine tetraphosphate (Ap4A) HIT family hydrolase